MMTPVMAPKKAPLFIPVKGATANKPKKTKLR